MEAPKRSFLQTHLQLITAAIALIFFAEGWVLAQALNPVLPPDPLTGVVPPHKPHWLPIAFFILAAAVGGFTTFRRGLGSLKRLTFDMNALMTIGVAGALAIGAFEEAAAVAMLYAVSNWLESRTMAKTREAIGELLALTPREATVRRDGRDVMVPVVEIQPGDILVVKPGERLAMDGTVLAGSSAVNQAPLTGESVPVPKEPGAPVLAGSINGAGALEVEVTHRAADSTLTRIIHMVEEAQAEKAPSQAFIDKFAAVYTPIVLVVALLVATVPLLLIDEAHWFDWVYRGLALIVLACPCALVVSTPVALAAAIGGAARHGLLIKGGRQIEAAATIKALAFDKTGTLTEGRPEVLNVAGVGEEDPQRVLAIAAALESRSEHPLATAIVRHAHKQGVAFTPAADFQATAHGGSAVLDGQRWHVGSAKYFEKLGIDLGEAAKLVDRFQNDGKTVVLVGNGAGPIGAIALQDALRGASRRTVIALNQLGVEPVVMLTGDHTQTARAIAKLAAIDEVKAELMPEDKVGAVKQLMAKYGPTAMVGDGINDAPALATAHVGVAMGKGTDVALETADVVLMNDDVARVPYFIRLSRETMAVIGQNIAFAIGIKVIAVLAIVPGWLTLWLAVIADMGATILVTLNALRLLAIKPSSGA